MIDYAACMAVLQATDENYAGAKWRNGETYEDLQRTWDDEQPIPSKASLDAMWPAVGADIAAIEDMPSLSELADVAFGKITGDPATAILDRRDAANAAKLRIP